MDRVSIRAAAAAQAPRLWALLLLLATLATDYWLLFGQDDGLERLGALAIPASLCGAAAMSWVWVSKQTSEPAERTRKAGNYLIAGAGLVAVVEAAYFIILMSAGI